MIHGQLLQLGERFWSGYHELRVKPQRPSCDPAKIGVSKGSKAEADLDDLLDEGGEAPKAEGDELDDLLDEGGEAPKAEGDELDDLLDEGGEAPKAEGDELDDLLGDGEEEPQVDQAQIAAIQAQAIEAARARCEEKHSLYLSTLDRLTPGVRRFRALEQGVSKLIIFGFEHQKQLLVLLLLICGITATSLRAHIALRPPKAALEDRITESLQLIVNLLLFFSSWSLRQVHIKAGVAGVDSQLSLLWMMGFALMALINIIHLIKPLPKQGGSPLKGLLAVPLYTTMGLISGGYFLLMEWHPAGLAIYLSKLTEHAAIYLQVGLYVWVGMLLKRMDLARLSFDVLRPWKMSPELLAFVVVVGAALPTAYSGASGIFVLAAGALIYDEMRRGGARRQLALATAALSGSLGVVLRPCLLVVIVASLNKQVTTDQLYHWGFRVFLLSALLFLGIALLARRAPIQIASPKQALPASLRAFGPLIPYLLLFGAFLLAYGLLLGAHLDEHTAPLILPVVMLALLLYDRSRARRLHRRGAEGGEPPEGLLRGLGAATSETTGYIGALLILMGLSVCLGGVVERADLMSMVPQSFGSIWLSMSVLVAVLVVVGMTMDPYGAVILVSATIATVAYRNGIHPIHFWMVVLAAFELGYLTPPVALNHLLVRQVVGEAAFEPDPKEDNTSFWSRHERILLPVTAKGIALLLVAYIPLIF